MKEEPEVVIEECPPEPDGSLEQLDLEDGRAGMDVLGRVYYREPNHGSLLCFHPKRPFKVCMVQPTRRVPVIRIRIKSIKLEIERV
jgi:hypothetical protein